MKKYLLSLSIVAAFIGLSTSVAHADVFDFTISSASYSGSGTITASEQGTSGIYDISAISGVLNGSSITALIPVAGQGWFNDNLLYYPEAYYYKNVTASNLTIGGIAFWLANGMNYNLWFGVVAGCPKDPGNTNQYFLSYIDMDHNDPVDFGLTAETAEPTSLLLLGTGALGAFLLLRRRRSAAQV